MNTTEIRELNAGELDQVSGGVDGTGNYKECLNGPAGAGTRNLHSNACRRT